MAQQEKTSNIKVLSIVWYKVLPPKFGGQKAIAFFNENLGKLTSLSCICSRNNETEKADYSAYNSLPISKTQFLNPFVWFKIYLVAKKTKSTHLILEFPYHGISGLICKKYLGTKLIINTHNIEFLRFKEQNKWWSGLLYYFEKWVLSGADMVFFKTDNDKERAKQIFRLKDNKVSTIFYGIIAKDYSRKIDARQFICNKHQIGKQEKIILFAGTLDYQPNADALVAIKKYIIPLLKKKLHAFKIIICGRNRSRQFNYLHKIKDPHLILLGEVEDIESYYYGSDVFISPVLSGGGIQTKIMDALSYHLNVVCFHSKSLAIHGAGAKIFPVSDGDWNDFANCIIKASISTEATESTFFEIYNWRTIAEKAFEKIVSA